MKRLKLRELVASKIVGHIELQSGVPLSAGENRGVWFATDAIVSLIQNNYRRRRKAVHA